MPDLKLVAPIDKLIAIEFDGILLNFFGQPVIDALQSVTKLIGAGYRVVVHTSRPEIEDIKTWLKAYNFPDLEVVNEKPNAIAYVDVRGIRFNTWTELLANFISTEPPSLQEQVNQAKREMASKPGLRPIKSRSIGMVGIVPHPVDAPATIDSEGSWGDQ